MRLLVLTLLAVLSSGCPAKPKPRTCFEFRAEENSNATTALFEQRHCQGGGVTWAALANAVVKRRGAVASAEHLEGWNGQVQTLGSTLFAIDEEGDAMLFCSDAPALTQAIQKELKAINADVSLLKKAMAEADPMSLECFEEKDAAQR
jgi:hypothetical protein